MLFFIYYIKPVETLTLKCLQQETQTDTDTHARKKKKRKTGNCCNGILFYSNKQNMHIMMTHHTNTYASYT